MGQHSSFCGRRAALHASRRPCWVPVVRRRAGQRNFMPYVHQRLQAGASRDLAAAPCHPTLLCVPCPTVLWACRLRQWQHSAACRPRQRQHSAAACLTGVSCCIKGHGGHLRGALHPAGAQQAHLCTCLYPSKGPHVNRCDSSGAHATCLRPAICHVPQQGQALDRLAPARACPPGNFACLPSPTKGWFHFPVGWWLGIEYAAACMAEMLTVQGGSRLGSGIWMQRHFVSGIWIGRHLDCKSLGIPFCGRWNPLLRHPTHA